jgi:hypothetical protein
MDIKLWHNKEMNLWRWTLIDRDLNMESGQQEDLKLAMVDIANTVEYLIIRKQDQEQTKINK